MSAVTRLVVEALDQLTVLVRQGFMTGPAQRDEAFAQDYADDQDEPVLGFLLQRNLDSGCSGRFVESNAGSRGNGFQQHLRGNQQPATAQN